MGERMRKILKQLSRFKQEQSLTKTAVKGNSLVKIIKWYAFIISVVILLFTSGLSYILGRSIFQKNEEAVKQAVLHISDIYNEDFQTTKWMMDKLLGTEQRINSVQKYFDMEISDYISYILKQDASKEESTYYFFPQEIKNIYLDNPYLDGLSFSFDNTSQFFVSDIKNKSGKLKAYYHPPKEDITITKAFFSEINGETLGTLQASFSRTKYDAIVKSYQNDANLQIAITGENDQTYYLSDQATAKEIEKKEIFLTNNNTTGDITVIGGVAKKSIWSSVVKQLAILWLVALGIVVLLVGLIYGRLTHYQNSVNDILFFLRDASDKKIEQRIFFVDKEDELQEIAEGINEMMDHIEAYVVTNYRLENEQKDANMRALQSQINPHFLYNTLEYIRMYAVNIEANELAQVVFSFSSLLRESMIQEKITTLADELSFCEKYAYLFQMRYPSEIDFSFTVQSNIGHVVIPKFILQPIVENYFKYGVDFDREDNLLTIKAYENSNKVIIEIIDNGLGMTEERLDEVKANLSEDFQRDFEKGTSIGLRNVYERLSLYYHGDFEFIIENNFTGGVRFKIVLPNLEGRETDG